MLKTVQGNNIQVLSVNNSIHVNSVDVPDSDLMATNGVIHVVKNVLYPGDLPVGSQDLLFILKKLIKYIQIKFVSGFSYTEIPLTFIKKTITTTHYIETVPDLTKVIKVIGEDPSVTTVTKVIGSDPVITKVTRVIGREPSVTTLTKVIEGEPSVTKVTRVIEGEPSITKVTRVIEGGVLDTDEKIAGPDFSKITTIHGNPNLIDEESQRIAKIIQGGGKFAAARKAPAGMRRRVKKVKRHHKPRQ